MAASLATVSLKEADMVVAAGNSWAVHREADTLPGGNSRSGLHSDHRRQASLSGRPPYWRMRHVLNCY